MGREKRHGALTKNVKDKASVSLDNVVWLAAKLYAQKHNLRGRATAINEACHVYFKDLINELLSKRGGQKE